MLQETNWFRALTGDFSRLTGIIGGWITLIVFARPRQAVLSMTAADDALWISNSMSVAFCAVVCFFIIVIGYRRLLEERSYYGNSHEKLMTFLRAISFLVPYVLLTCMFILCTVYFLGFFPRQHAGYSVMYTSAIFAIHNATWGLTSVFDQLLPYTSVMTRPDDATRMFGMMCKAASIVTLFAALMTVVINPREDRQGAV